MKVYLSYFILMVGSGLIVPNIVLYLEDDDGIVNWFVFSQSEVFSVALTIVSFKALFAIEGEDTLIDIDDTRSLEVVFRFVPLFFTWAATRFWMIWEWPLCAGASLGRVTRPSSRST